MIFKLHTHWRLLACVCLIVSGLARAENQPPRIPDPGPGPGMPTELRCQEILTQVVTVPSHELPAQADEIAVADYRRAFETNRRQFADPASALARTALARDLLSEDFQQSAARWVVARAVPRRLKEKTEISAWFRAQQAASQSGEAPPELAEFMGEALRSLRRYCGEGAASVGDRYRELPWRVRVFGGVERFCTRWRTFAKLDPELGAYALADLVRESRPEALEAIAKFSAAQRGEPTSWDVGRGMRRLWQRVRGGWPTDFPQRGRQLVADLLDFDENVGTFPQLGQTRFTEAERYWIRKAEMQAEAEEWLRGWLRALTPHQRVLWERMFLMEREAGGPQEPGVVYGLRIIRIEVAPPRGDMLLVTAIYAPLALDSQGRVRRIAGPIKSGYQGPSWLGWDGPRPLEFSWVAPRSGAVSSPRLWIKLDRSRALSSAELDLIARAQAEVENFEGWEPDQHLHRMLNSSLRELQDYPDLFRSLPLIPEEIWK